MSARVIVTGILIVFIMAMSVFFAEMLVPVSVYNDFNQYCRMALIRMEVNGGITEEIENDLYSALTNLNLKEVNITGNKNIKYGEFIRLNVTAVLETNMMSSLFKRSLKRYNISYERTTVSRKVLK